MLTCGVRCSAGDQSRKPDPPKGILFSEYLLAPLAVWDLNRKVRKGSARDAMEFTSGKRSESGRVLLYRPSLCAPCEFLAPLAVWVFEPQSTQGWREGRKGISGQGNDWNLGGSCIIDLLFALFAKPLRSLRFGILTTKYARVARGMQWNSRQENDRNRAGSCFIDHLFALLAGSLLPLRFGSLNRRNPSTFNLVLNIGPGCAYFPTPKGSNINNTPTIPMIQPQRG
jgi:hypothetical protein